MVVESNNFNQNFGFQSNTCMYGNNPMNPSLNNVFTNQHLVYNSSQKTPMNLNFRNSSNQVLTLGGSSVNPPVHPFLLATSISPPDHPTYLKNNGLLAASSSNEVGLFKKYSSLIHSNASQQLKPPMEVPTLATNSHVRFQEFGSSANPCIGGDKSTMADPKSKKKNDKKSRNGIKGHWIQEEDRMLLNLVEKYGNKKWSYIARMMPGRLGKQLRERYNNHLKPGLKKEAWTEEEDMKLIQAHEKIGNKWAEISKLLPGRSESDIKNRWNATKRKCINAIQKSSSNPKPSSLFENYVKTMFKKMGQSSPTSAESSAMAGASSGGSNIRQALTDGSVSVEDYGVSSFDPNMLPNYNGPTSQFESMTYVDMLLQ